MSQRFQNRVDYVSIAAYGIGKVTVQDFEQTGGAAVSEDSSDDEEDEFGNYSNKEKRLYTKIKALSRSVESICASVCAMGSRQDDRFNMVFEKEEHDEMQEQILKKLYSNEQSTLNRNTIKLCSVPTYQTSL